MAIISVLVTVPDSTEVVASAVLRAAAPSALPPLPSELVPDPSFPAVPFEWGAVQQSTVAMMSAGMAINQTGSHGYVIRALLDDQYLDIVSQRMRTSDGPRIFADPQIAPMPVCPGTPAVGTALDVRRLLGAGRLLQMHMDGSGVALAIVDTGINLAYLQGRGLTPTLDVHSSWTASPYIVPGQAVLGHGTMCAYDALLLAPNVLLLDHAVLTATPPGGSAMTGTLSNAVGSYAVLAQLMALSAAERHFHSLVVSNSWGMFKASWDFPTGNPGRYGDNLAHPFNVLVRNLSAAGADVIFAAGNCGPICPDSRCDIPVPPIFLANSHDDVLCVAGVDTTGTVAGYSSLGPGILGNQKPDLAGYTHFVGSEVFGRGKPDSGTSAACPVVAGTVAALRAIYPYDPTLPNRTPGSVRRFLTSNASGSGAWRQDWGNGILDTAAFVNAGRVL
jgi:subtilisin family serine protease